MGLGFNPLEEDPPSCRITFNNDNPAARRRVEDECESVFPSGVLGSEEFARLVDGKVTLVDQKVVSFTDFPWGKSRMNRPSSDSLQNPPRTASEVQTYVFCYVMF